MGLKIKLKRYADIFKKALTVMAVAFALSLLVSCSLNAVNFAVGTPKVRVDLKDCDGITVEGANYADIYSGKSAEFTFKLKEGYIYVGNSADASYNPKTGRLMLSNVRYPTSIEVFVINTNKMIKLNIESPNVLLVCDDSVYDGYYDAGATAVVTAYETSTYTFNGWSVGGYIKDGGRLVSTELEYSFVMSEGTKLYANYIVADQYVITYHANGGKVAKNGGDTLVAMTKRNTQFTCRNTLYSNGTFVRDGYVAVGYSTQPVNFEDYASVNDIPGFSNMGGICVVPDESGELDLYVVWAKCTSAGDFTFAKAADGYTVKSYRGKGGTVVVPTQINGTPIVSVSKGAFSSSEIKNVVLPDTVKALENGAFNNCKNLSQLVFFDSITSVSNDSFVSCTSLATLVLNSQRNSYYSGSAEGSFCMKYERVKTAAGKMLVVVSGSSTLNGMLSERFQEKYPDYTIVNYGTNAGTPSYFYLKVISNYVGEGDIIVHAGEYGGTTLGSNKIEWKLFRGNEQSYDIFREVDMTEFTNFWGAYQEFQNDRGPSGSDYQKPCSSMNEYGDLISNRRANNGFSASGSYNFNSPRNYLSDDNAKRLNEVSSIIVSKGGVMLCSFATLDLDAVAAASRNQAAYDNCTRYFADKLDYPVISNVGDYVYEHSYFYDSIWHCTLDGAALRTQRLLRDIEAYLESPSSY